MSDHLYKRPPITEAIIQIKFAPGLEEADIHKAMASFAKFYPHEEKMQNFDLAVEVHQGGDHPPTTQINRQEFGRRGSSYDLTEIILAWPESLTVSQLAPYPGWEVFFARFARDWELWKAITGFRKVVRVGVRFINRVDIPLPVNEVVDESEYLNIYPKTPTAFGNKMGYAIQALFPIQDLGLTLLINSALAPSPLLKHLSFMIDLDIFIEKDIPQSTDGMYGLLNKIRAKKNEVFEACVTDKARDLFKK